MEAYRKLHHGYTRANAMEVMESAKYGNLQKVAYDKTFKFTGKVGSCLYTAVLAPFVRRLICGKLFDRF